MIATRERAVRSCGRRKRSKGFRGGIASQKIGRNFKHLLNDAAPEKVLWVGKEDLPMFMGTVIDELIATVERAEERTHVEQSLIEDERLTYFYTLSQQEMAQFELAGVA